MQPEKQREITTHVQRNYLHIYFSLIINEEITRLQMQIEATYFNFYYKASQQKTIETLQKLDKAINGASLGTDMKQLAKDCIAALNTDQKNDRVVSKIVERLENAAQGLEDQLIPYLSKLLEPAEILDAYKLLHEDRNLASNIYNFVENVVCAKDEAIMKNQLEQFQRFKPQNVVEHNHTI